MTDQLFLFRCKDVRKHACEYRRGELHAAERRKFEEHLAHCEACQDHVDRLENMLDAAATYDFGAGLDRDAIFAAVTDAIRADADDEPDERADEHASDEARTRPGDTSPLDRDALFARITKEIAADLDAAAAPPAARFQIPPPVEDETPTPQEDEPAPARSAAPWIVAALAAGVLIGFLLPALFRADEVRTVPDEIAENAPSVPATAPTPPPEPAAAVLADLALQPTPAGFDDVRVFGSPTADWSIRTQGKRRKMTLESGSVLVEFVPGDDTTLQFETDDFTVRVTGTIFYASADPVLVGVVTGSVEVDTPEGATIELTDGQEWSPAGGVHVADARVRADATRFVDPVRHREALAPKPKDRPKKPRPEPPPRVEAPRPRLSKAVVATPTRSLRAEADAALREGRYDEAAQYYERMVEELSADDPANASLRLDLARIYIQHLDRDARAVTHLRHFVEDRPADPATPSARAELCRIVAGMGARDALCEAR